MNLPTPTDARNRSRFWLALSLSTVTALAVTVPLAFRAAGADSSQGGPAAEVPTQEVPLPDAEVAPDAIVVETTEPPGPQLPVIAVRPDVETDLLLQPGSVATGSTTTSSTPTIEASSTTESNSDDS